MYSNLPRRILFIPLALIAFTVVSCDKQGGCTDPAAENFDPAAEVENGTCTLQREKFIGVYVGQASCLQPPNGIYQSEVTPANDNLRDIFIYNLAGRFSNPVRAIVDRSTLIIQSQDPDGIGLYISGFGTIIGNNLNISFETGYGGESNNCQYDLNK
jgi:hypothetical protein